MPFDFQDSIPFILTKGTELTIPQGIKRQGNSIPLSLIERPDIYDFIGEKDSSVKAEMTLVIELNGEEMGDEPIVKVIYVDFEKEMAGAVLVPKSK